MPAVLSVNLRPNLNYNWPCSLRSALRKPACALEAFGPEKRQKSAKFFRITDFFVFEREIVAGRFRDSHACAGGNDPACDRRPRCAGFGADRNRQDAGIPDSGDGTADAGKGAWSGGARASPNPRTPNAKSPSALRVAWAPTSPRRPGRGGARGRPAPGGSAPSGPPGSAPPPPAGTVPPT